MFIGHFGVTKMSMPYKLSFAKKPAYLHAIVSGPNSAENVPRYLEEVMFECTVRGYQRLLIEERLDGPRLGTTQVFQLASEGSSRAHGQFTAIAYVDVNAEGDLMKFAETVAVNRGLPVKVFATVLDAEKWLLGTNGAGAAPDAPADTGEPRAQ
jgi:hypothetical protein